MRLAFKNDPDIIVISNEASPIFAFTSNTVNCIALSDEMVKRKWTLAKLQRPHGAHIAITDASQSHWKEFVAAVRECVKDMKADPTLNKNHSTALYGLTGMIPD